MTTSIACHHILVAANITLLSVEWFATYQSMLLLVNLFATMFVRLPSCPATAFLSRSFCMSACVRASQFVWLCGFCLSFSSAHAYIP